MASVATMGILVALLLPAVQAAREAARRNSSMNNMKQIMLALMNYEAAKRSFPAHASYDAAGKPLLSWRVHILPYMEQQALYKQFHLNEPWDSEHNRKLIPLMPEMFVDPSTGLSAQEGKSSYLGVEGAGYFFSGANEPRTTAYIQDKGDGVSKTISVVQVNEAAAVPWTKPQDWKPDQKNLMQPFGGTHPGGFIAGFADGNVQFFSSEIDAKVFKALLTVAGGEEFHLDGL
jgi:type II secretory pathway pseudopilin PulG